MTVTVWIQISLLHQSIQSSSSWRHPNRVEKGTAHCCMLPTNNCWVVTQYIQGRTVPSSLQSATPDGRTLTQTIVTNQSIQPTELQLDALCWIIHMYMSCDSFLVYVQQLDNLIMLRGSSPASLINCRIGWLRSVINSCSQVWLVIVFSWFSLVECFIK